MRYFLFQNTKKQKTKKTKKAYSTLLAEGGLLKKRSSKSNQATVVVRVTVLYPLGRTERDSRKIYLCFMYSVLHNLDFQFGFGERVDEIHNSGYNDRDKIVRKMHKRS